MKALYSIVLSIALMSLVTICSHANDDGDKKSKRKAKAEKKSNSTSTEVNGNYKHQYANNQPSIQTQSNSKLEKEVIDHNYKHQGPIVLKDTKTSAHNTSTKKVTQKKNNVSYKHQFGL